MISEIESLPRKKVKMQNNNKFKKFQEELPIFKYKSQILELVEKNRVIVIAGETGSGKTTQIPQYLFSNYNSICISQPRRISAITLANRVAEQLNCKIGQQVGYSVRFQEVRSQKTKIHFLTDGMAIRQMMLKKKYQIFVLDQAHQRSVNTDILLSILKQTLQRTNKLKLIIMSATIDISKFLHFFDSDAYLNIEGRVFPIHLYYTLQPVPDYIRACINTILQIHFEEKQGDILVFLTGQQQILTVEKALRQKITQFEDPQKKNMNILTLFSALPSELQLKVFQKSIQKDRKVILSTNIAETSITIDGIKYVVDCGFCKIRVFDHEKNMQILAIVPISKSNALQRAGRAGRQSEGKCFRLFVKNIYQQLPDHHLPEILRVDISGSILQLKVIGIKLIKQFEFIDRPSQESINFSLQLLKQIKALDQNEQITKKGHELAQLPLVPELSHLLILSLQKQYNCADLMLSCISILTVQNLFYVPQKQNLQKVLKRYEYRNSDHLTKINIFHYYINCTNKKSFCKQNFINSKNIKRAIEVRQQLQQYLIQICIRRLKSDHFFKFDEKIQKNKYLQMFSINSNIKGQERFLKCLSKGSIRRSAKLNSDGTYIIHHSNQTAKIHPESLCFYSKPKPDMIVFNQIVKTQKVYLRDVSQVCI